LDGVVANIEGDRLEGNPNPDTNQAAVSEEEGAGSVKSIKEDVREEKQQKQHSVQTTPRLESANITNPLATLVNTVDSTLDLEIF
jgi:hypothetical protein